LLIAYHIYLINRLYPRILTLTSLSTGNIRITTYLLRCFPCGWLCSRCHQTDSSVASSVQPHPPLPLLYSHTT